MEEPPKGTPSFRFRMNRSTIIQLVAVFVVVVIAVIHSLGNTRNTETREDNGSATRIDILTVEAPAVDVKDEEEDEEDEEYVYEDPYHNSDQPDYWVVHPTIGALPVCDLSLPADSICAMEVWKLKPTQMTVGMQEVLCKARELEESKYLERFVKKDYHIPVVIGPDGLYVTDHHHFTRGAVIAKIPEESKVAYIKVQENLSNYTKAAFWQKMMENGWSWLCDDKGNMPMHYSFAPSLIADMANDPYRFLAYLVRKFGGFKKSRKLYAEFFWANYFRERMQFNIRVDSDEDYISQAPYKVCDSAPYSSYCFPDEQQQIESMLSDAVKLAKCDEAKDLPGYDPTWDEVVTKDGSHTCGFGFYFDGEHKRRAREAEYF